MKKIDTNNEMQEASRWASLLLPLDLMVVVGCAVNAPVAPTVPDAEPPKHVKEVPEAA